MSRQSARLSCDGHQVTIYHASGRERVVEPGFAIIAVVDPDDWMSYTAIAVREEAVTPDDCVLQHGSTAEQWTAALAEYERRTASLGR